MTGLEGAVYEVRAAEDISTPDGTLRCSKGEVVDTITTSSDGFVKSKELYLGKYEVKEITAPYGMVVSGETHTVELTYAGQNISVTETSTSFYNERQKVQVSLVKAIEKDKTFGIGDNGEIKNISILEPVEYAKRDGTTGISYNVKKVFDVSQTNGKRPPAPTVNRDPKALITVMLDSSPVEVEATNELPYPNMAAFYNNEEQTLYVKRDVGDSVAVAQCVAQELGHAQLSINSDSYSRADMGFQAVCIGYMLCKKYGVDTQNFAINRIPEKLAGKEPKDIRYELSKTRNAMEDIHSRVSDELYKKKQERSKDYER